MPHSVVIANRQNSPARGTVIIRSSNRSACQFHRYRCRRYEGIVNVPHGDLDSVEDFNFGGVTARLQVNANLHDPFLCVTGVDDIVSGDLSLPRLMGR
jgi:hypothetical protein